MVAITLFANIGQTEEMRLFLERAVALSRETIAGMGVEVPQGWSRCFSMRETVPVGRWEVKVRISDASLDPRVDRDILIRQIQHTLLTHRPLSATLNLDIRLWAVEEDPFAELWIMEADGSATHIHGDNIGHATSHQGHGEFVCDACGQSAYLLYE